jgi:hypothetical protein
MRGKIFESQSGHLLLTGTWAFFTDDQGKQYYGFLGSNNKFYNGGQIGAKGELTHCTSNALLDIAKDHNVADVTFQTS